MLKRLIENKDYDGIALTLSEHPYLANEGMPYDNENATRAHPLHRICDAVFSGKLSDIEAVQIAKIFLAHGANVDGDGLIPGKDTPLIAASSLSVDAVANLLIENRANIHHAGTHGGTALHWAAWCGRVDVVNKLIREGVVINQLSIDFLSTPLFWAVHGIKMQPGNLQGSLECIKMLLEAGADKNIPNAEGKWIVDLLSDGDMELKAALNIH